MGSGFGGDGPGLPGSRPKLLRSPRPPYPPLAREAGFEGRVLLDVQVASSGEVRSVSLRRSSGRDDCDLAALNTVKQEWEFKPATLNGVPVEWNEKVVVIYKLR